MKYLCLLVPQAGTPHLRFDFFSMTKDKRERELFILIGLPEKNQIGGVGLEDIFF